ncbi:MULTISPECIES: amidohydrolase family protein [unclassified Streptomyces]|uniref:N-acyl-D-amino-acid deacylase family protein n=1 Tax=unclassified Streptomyces TaxID=2593676 RepID=UPI00168AEE8E|nr:MULTISPECIES: D-aminoacylase [unclassified Streptomyces]MBD3008270.1 D-aminoacylase [Streptomyces sp. 5-10]
MYEYDVLAVGGTVIDGTGGPARRADVGIRGDRIVFLGRATPHASAREVLDCAGHVVVPGFIDLHSHADFTVRDVPSAEACIRQGVTTIVTGNCGSSPFPVVPERRHAVDTTLARTGSGDMPWEDFDGFARAVEEAEPCVNLAALVGHSALRVAAVGTELRPATANETVLMRGLLARAAGQGVFGLSTGLIYAPGSFAATDEVVALATEAQRAGLLYSTHIRDEGDHLLEAVTEALDTARHSGVRLQISHLKAMGPANHGKVHKALALIDSAVEEGLDVACDVYPYAASSTRLTSRLPDWALDGGLDALLARLNNPKTREAIAAELRAKTGHTFLPEGTVIAALPPGRYSSWVGSTVQDIAAATGRDPAEASLDVLHAHQAQVWIINHAMSEADVETVLRHPLSAVVSDGWELDTATDDHPHPRHFGAFARVLARYTRDREVLTFQEAVRKMSALPAARLGLTDRGTLSEGMVADLAVFDAETVSDTATYDAPLSYAEGTRHVLVNGRPVLRDGAFTTHRPGTVLRKTAARSLSH